MRRLPRSRLLTRTGSLLLLVVAIPAVALGMNAVASDVDEPGPRARAPSNGAGEASPASDTYDPAGIFKLDHLIFVVQENRSFDHYFGTYPGADGFEMVHGEPTNCVPDPVLGRPSCVYHSSRDDFKGGPHSRPAALAAIGGGALDGFIDALPPTDRWCVDRATAACAGFVGPERQPDVMSYLTRANIPNYWAYADRFALQDRMFAPTDGWTLPAHLFLVSGWSAFCYDPRDPMSCISN